MLFVFIFSKDALCLLSYYAVVLLQMQQGEFQALCSFLALEPNTRSPIAEAGATGAGKFSVPLNVFGGAECVQWLCSNPGAMVENWCRTLGQFAFTEPQKAKVSQDNPLTHSRWPSQYIRVSVNRTFNKTSQIEKLQLGW